MKQPIESVALEFLYKSKNNAIWFFNRERKKKSHFIQYLHLEKANYITEPSFRKLYRKKYLQHIKKTSVYSYTNSRRKAKPLNFKLDLYIHLSKMLYKPFEVFLSFIENAIWEDQTALSSFCAGDCQVYC